MKSKILISALSIMAFVTTFALSFSQNDRQGNLAFKDIEIIKANARLHEQTIACGFGPSLCIIDGCEFIGITICQ
jgi:hypothetical protein